MTIKTLELSSQEILKRLDIIAAELQALRRDVWGATIQKETHEVDLVESLAGSLGPGSWDELEEFNNFEISWQRFSQ